MLKLLCAVLGAAMGLAAPQWAVAASSPEKLAAMADLLDKLDREDFLEGLEKANGCTTRRNFSCADTTLQKVKKLINGSADKKLWDMASNYRQAEQRRIDDEVRAEQERVARIAEQERRAEAALAQQRQAEEDRERRAQEAREAAVTRQGVMAIVGAVAIGKATSGSNYTDAQRSALVDSYVKDRVNAIDGVQSNNFGQQAETVKRELDANGRARIAAADEARRQQTEQMRVAMDERRAEEGRVATAQAHRRAAAMEARPVTVAAAQPELPKYQPQVVVIPSWRQTCPPGSSPMRHSNGVAMTNPAGAICVKDAQSTAGQGTAQGQSRVASNSGSGSNAGSGSGSNSSSDRPASASGTTTRPPTSDSSSGNTRSDSPTQTMPVKSPPKINWGPVKLESIAICRQSTKSGKWECNGALDNQIIVDEPTLESALARQHCSGGTWAAGGPIIKDVQWDAYRCGHSLGAGDYDVAKRYGLITARRSYMCPLHGEDRCTTLYDGQDKR